MFSSDVNKDSSLKAQTKDLTLKARTKDQYFKAKDRPRIYFMPIPSC